MIRFIIILISSLFLMNCTPKRLKNLPPAEFVPTLNLMTSNMTATINLPDSMILPPTLILSMEKKPCFVGKCPVFKIEFFNDGSIQYEGKSYVNKYGKHQAQISQDELKILVTMANNIGYLDFYNVYPPHGKIIYDVPLTITYVKYYAGENYVENHHHAPVGLIRYEEHIEGLIENLDWEKISAL